jgi:hypothetical protein
MKVKYLNCLSLLPIHWFSQGPFEIVTDPLGMSHAAHKQYPIVFLLQFLESESHTALAKTILRMGETESSVVQYGAIICFRTEAQGGEGIRHAFI